jgi:hypothetical protein
VSSKGPRRRGKGKGLSSNTGASSSDRSNNNNNNNNNAAELGGGTSDEDRVAEMQGGMMDNTTNKMKIQIPTKLSETGSTTLEQRQRTFIEDGEQLTCEQQKYRFAKAAAAPGNVESVCQLLNIFVLQDDRHHSVVFRSQRTLSSISKCGKA